VITTANPDLLFTLTPGEETWTVVGPTPDSGPHRVPSPLADAGLMRHVRDLRYLSGRKFRSHDEEPIRYYTEAALQLSERITALLLSEEARRAVRIRLNQVHLGRARLTLRMAEQGPLGDQALALPWELVAPDPPELPVRQSLLDVVREVVTPGAPELPEPSDPFSVAVAVAAPEGETTLSYEKEEVRLQTALATLGHAAVFSDLGTLEALVELVELHRASAILFSGHGLPGRLLFENRLGFADPVPVEELVRRLRSVLLASGRSGSFPGLFFLSSCDGATSDDGPSVAAALHRAGFSQVIGYFSAVRESAAIRAEETFFRCLARGDTALQAGHRARASLVDVVEHEGEPFVFPLAWTQLAIYHRGVDRPMAGEGRKAVRLLPARFRRRQEERNGVPVLTRGFVGRRGLQHEVLRRVEGGERLIVLQGLGGTGKTVLAGHLLTRRLALSSDPAGSLFLRVPAAGETRDPILALRAQVEEHGRRHGSPGWEERVEALRAQIPASAAGFAATLREVAAARPAFAVCLDGLDRLMAGPGSAREPGVWLPEAAEWWREVEGLAAEGFLVLASTRYAGADLPVRSHVGVPPLSASDAFRMMAFFAELSDLGFDERQRLAGWSDGHPGMIERLEREIAEQRRRQGLGYSCGDPWGELVEPALSRAVGAVRRELRLDELWAALPGAAREQARRIAATGKPLTLKEIDGLGGERGSLIRCGLLVRYLQEVRGPERTLRWTERWGLPRWEVVALVE
jgi:hypothetical protein